MSLTGWGRVPIADGREIRSEELEVVTRAVPLTRGLGRAYGDAALPAAPDTVVAGSRLADRILGFDETTGLLRAEAGFSLDHLYRVLLRRGWFTPVTPGTRFVTLGGMVAADVHGKNHHRDGCIGEHVEAITLRVADGQILRCSRDSEPELFRATIGGMGLTGHILEVSLRLVRVRSPWILQQTERVPDIDAFVDRLKEAAAVWPMTVGWIDSVARGGALGRGVLLCGRWAEPSEATDAFPELRPMIDLSIDLPGGMLSTSLVRLMNAAYYHRFPAHKTQRLVSPESFLYPLDAIGSWNRGYGRRGFIQYQCVLPEAGARGSVRQFMTLVARHQRASFLSVIKDCGPEGTGMLSFPMPGISIALDIPYDGVTQALVDEMNRLVIEHGGRIYLAKDALTRADDFRAMEPRLDTFLAVRRFWDPDGKIRSAQSTRLFGW
ncbi:MAG TPA: FAD-binding oxidoreductase [Vicinamibacterales bacterium]|nr:FAD-binding oxidoreductase [Vicinamibacterales bacterium]